MRRFRHEGARRVQPCQAFSDLETDSLKLADFLPEGLAPVDVARGDLQRGAGEAGRTDCAGYPFGDHHLVEDFVHFMPCPSDSRRARAHRKNRLALSRRRVCPADHRYVALPRLVALNQQRSEGLVTRRIRVCARVDHEQVRALRTDNESLLTVQDVVGAFPPCSCCRTEEIRAACAQNTRTMGG